MCLEISSFDLGKYIFDNPSESDMIDQILQSHLTKKPDQKQQLPCLDTYLMKSHMLREVLTDNFLTKAKSSQQWDVVRETREKILARIQSIEEGVGAAGESHVLREELKSMKDQRSTGHSG
jgi:hypothetical protein